VYRLGGMSSLFYETELSPAPFAKASTVTAAAADSSSSSKGRRKERLQRAKIRQAAVNT
jgi:hypothetical protein